MGSYSSSPEVHHDVRYFTDQYLYPTNMRNIMKSIYSISTYINTTTNMFPNVLLILYCVMRIGSLSSLWVLIWSGVYWIFITRQPGMKYAYLHPPLVFIFQIAAMISTQWCFKYDLVATWRQCNGNCSIKSDNVQHYTLVAWVGMIQYTLCLSRPVIRAIWKLQ